MTSIFDQDTQPILDHVVVLVSPKILLELPDQLKDSFTVAPGGEHADGLTFNKLILLPDGVYVELIAFHDDADPEKRKSHRWGQLPENTIIDWAYTLQHEKDFTTVQERVRNRNTGYLYDDPVPGGRKRPDGEVLKWAVAAARQEDGKPSPRGRLPFWCLDRTPRRLRVPYQDNFETNHRSGARGIAQVEVHVPVDKADGLAGTFDAIHEQTRKGNALEWRYKVPSQDINTDGKVLLKHDGSGKGIVVIFLGTKDSPSEVELVPGVFVRFVT